MNNCDASVISTFYFLPFTWSVAGGGRSGTACTRYKCHLLRHGTLVSGDLSHGPISIILHSALDIAVRDAAVIIRNGDSELATGCWLVKT